MENETCECNQCLENETPCHMDCDLDDMCEGCAESSIEAQEQEFEAKSAWGML